MHFVFPVRPSGTRPPENRPVSSSSWRKASRGSGTVFTGPLAATPHPEAAQAGAREAPPGPAPTPIPTPPGPLLSSCLLTGSSNLGSRTGNQIDTDKPDEKRTFADDHMAPSLLLAAFPRSEEVKTSRHTPTFPTQLPFNSIYLLHENSVTFDTSSRPCAVPGAAVSVSASFSSPWRPQAHLVNSQVCWA